MTVLLNAILDPLFIFTFDMGIRGAAVATILAQVVALVLVVVWFCDKRELIHFERGIFRLERRIVKDSIPIAGYNYGARQMSRVYEVLKKTLLYATVVLTAGFLIGELCPGLVVAIFTDDPELMEKSIKGMRLVVGMFPLVSLSMVIGNFFQSIGQPKQAIFLSLSRQVVFLIPSLWILPMFFDIAGVWVSFMVSDFLASAVAIILLLNFIKKNRPHEQLQS